MHLIPNHAREQELLDVVGAANIGELFASIPEHLQVAGLDLPPAEPEQHLRSRLYRLLGRNSSYQDMPIFLGGGNKPQPVPSAVQAVIHRQELKNAYTPYQPEVSQGLLQCLFEYQSLMCDITDMEVVNSSMYDHATALGEAALMATRQNRRTRFLVPEGLSWQKRSVLENYGRGAGVVVDTFGFDDVTGEADADDLAAKLGDDVSGVYVESPNHFGVFETNVKALGELAQDAGALFVMGVDPTTLGITKRPGELGADIVVGEASCFGGAPALGGPILGLFGCRESLVRKMPGRLIGATLDGQGRRGYVMTLQAREQHIRRSKATSNICSNEALIANQAAMHLSMLGRRGLRELGLLNLEAGAKLRDVLTGAGLTPRFNGSTYNEVLTAPSEPNLPDLLLEQQVHGGQDIGRDVASLQGCLLWGSTPVHRGVDYESLRDALHGGGAT